MSAFDVYTVRIADWAYAMEITSPRPTDGVHEGEFVVEKGTEGLVAAVSQNDAGDPISPEDLDLQIIDPRGHSVDSTETDTLYTVARDYEGYRQVSLLVMVNPPAGPWKVSLKSHGRTPFFVYLSVFGARTNVPGAVSSSTAPAIPRPRCRVCKITARALALAIIAAATLPALPHALIAAVAAYLGVATVVAAAFISSVLGDTTNVIAEKLCRAVRLC
jgi:hypothetical protein